MNLQPFDLTETPLADGVTLLEASAGTGKTYTITAIFLRLLLERHVEDLRQVLAVTFTVDATAELKSRIRAGLVEADRVFHSDDYQSPALGFLSILKERHPDGGPVIRRALRRYDDIAVTTIHGFCRKVLERQAFESGVPFRVDFIDDEHEPLMRAAADYWRRHVVGARPLITGTVHELGLDPEALIGVYQSRHRFPRTRVEPAPLPWDDATRALARAVTAARDLEPGDRASLSEVRFYAGRKGFPSGHTAAEVSARLQLFLGGDDLEVGAAFAFGTGDLQKRIQKRSPVPHEHPAVARIAAVAAAIEGVRISLLDRFCREVNHEFRNEKRRSGLLDHNDLLHEVHRNLNDPDRGAGFAEAMRSQWQVALVDEFQDTDTIQFEIFEQVFGNERLFVIGDPKQAIYGFRGADVYAYLEARKEAVAQYTLEHNWRSHPDLVAALNQTFGRLALPFADPKIQYQQVSAAKKELQPLVCPGRSNAALQWWLFERKDMVAAQATAWIRTAIANECVRLLRDGSIGGAPVRPNQIAILVRANRDAPPLQATLAEAGVPSVIGKAGDVLESDEAQELALVLHAVAAPSRTERVRAAIGTLLWGGTADQLVADADDAWQEATDLLEDVREIWLRLGFATALEHFLSGRHVRSRLLVMPGGQRRLTNLLQLAEILHERTALGSEAPEALVQWFLHTRARRDLDEDQREMRLEDDVDAVRILTIHRSKGLEYDIVFAPFLWRGKPPGESQQPFTVHEDGETVLDCGSARRDMRKNNEDWEQLGENLRLAYVALTRARYRAYVTMPLTYNVEKTTAPWVLTGPGKDEPAEHSLENVQTAIHRRLKEHAWPTLDGVAVELHVELPHRDTWQDPDPRDETARPRRAPFIPRSASVESFTSLSPASHGESGWDVEDAGDPTPPIGIHAFARGPRAGICLHSVMERIDFTGTRRRNLRTAVARILDSYGFGDTTPHYGLDDPTGAVIGMIKAMAATPWPGATDGTRFGEVTPADRLDEWTFHLPLPELVPAQIAATFATYGGSPGQEYASFLAGLSEFPVRGFLTGAVDLVAHVDGRYWVVDWKSNYVGPTASHYDDAALHQTMIRHHYVLQGHLYLVALRRYLAHRVPDRDPDDLIGGIVYVFLRGLDGEGGGLWHTTPPSSLMTGLDDLLGGTP